MREPAKTDTKFRILALDGGGIKGAFTAEVLAAWEDRTRRRVADHFDLIAGTSTGGIIAIALGLGIPAAKITDFYRQEGPHIFPNHGPVQRHFRNLRHLFAPKYSSAALRESLRSVLGERKFGESQTRLIITTYDAVGGRIFLMKTAHHPQFAYDYQRPAIDIALTTSAAPTYFSPAEFAGHADNLYIDGGVWANNPVLPAIVEANRFLDIPFDQMDVLSIGTTHEPPHLAAKMDWGPLHWLPPGAFRWSRQILNLMFNAQMESSLAMAELLTRNHIVRIDDTVPEGWFAMDAIDQVKAMIALGHGIAVKNGIMGTVTQRFLNGIPTPGFTPCYQV